MAGTVRSTVRQRPVRLTRRGRAVLVGFFVLAAVLVIAVLAPASRAADPAGAASRIAVVQPGDTLWSIAERHSPTEDRVAAVEEIRRLNRLDSYAVHAGQRLAVPSLR